MSTGRFSISPAPACDFGHDCAGLISEQRISLNQFAREQNISLSTAWRWCLGGIRGHALESFSVGGRKYTTREAFDRFIARTNEHLIPAFSTGERKVQKDAAVEELKQAGLIEQ